MNDPAALSDWIAHVFDHPVTDPAWHWSLDAPGWDGTSEQTAVFIAETFERSDELLARFTDAQLNQGFWYLLFGDGSGLLAVLGDPVVPLAVRLRALRSFVPLFEQVMGVRCSPHLSHPDEEPANPLNAACYMWWDILPVFGGPTEAGPTEFDAEVLSVLARLLTIPHDACRESALHGIGEWHCYYPCVERIVDDWLAQTPGLRPELVSYAQCARTGMIQ